MDHTAGGTSPNKVKPIQALANWKITDLNRQYLDRMSFCGSN